MKLIAVGSTSLVSAIQCAAHSLASQLHLPYIPPTCTDFKYLLVLTDQHLELHQVGSKMKPLVVDFLSPSLIYRRQHSGKRQLLARAVGVGKQQGKGISVLDATMGLGEDAFVLASLGCRVQGFERSPVVAALLQDGLRRLFASESFEDLALAVTPGDVRDYWQSSSEPPDVVYLDPMFPPRQKTALVKKQMQWLQDLLQDEADDAEELLQLGLKWATKRVVVKRPRLALPLAGLKPDLVLSGRSVRFDVYFKTTPSP